jgi:hypothetical protein
MDIVDSTIQFLYHVRHGHLPEVRHFVDQHNVMTSRPSLGLAALLHAINCDREQIVKYFVEEKMAHNNARMMLMGIISRVAFDQQKYYCAAYLLTMGLPIPADAEAPLVAVVRSGNFGVIGKMLRDGHCNINQPGRSGETALDVAIRKRQWRVARVLMQAGCKVATWPAIGEHAPYPKATQCPLVVRHLLGRVNVKHYLMMVYAYASRANATANATPTATPKDDCAISSDKKAKVTADDRRIKMRQTTHPWQQAMGHLVGVQGSTYIPADVFVCVMKYV